MQFRILSLFALIAAAVAQQGSGDNAFKIPPGGITFTAGQPATISWTPSTGGTVTLKLREGAASALNPGTVIKSKLFLLSLPFHPCAVGNELRLFSPFRLVSFGANGIYRDSKIRKAFIISDYAILIHHLSPFSWYPQQWPIHLHTRRQHRAWLRLYSRNHLRLRPEQEQLHTTIRHRIQEHCCIHHT